MDQRTLRTGAPPATARKTVLLKVAVMLMATAATGISGSAQQPAVPPTPEGSLSGNVRSAGRPLPLAQVEIPGTPHKTVANEQGSYQLAPLAPGQYTVIVRRIGYAPAERRVLVADGDALRIDFDLQPATAALAAVVVTGTLREQYVSESPVKVDVVTERFLQRNTTNNLMDNLSFVNGLQQQIDCGVCFTNNIRINGMEGPYTAVLIDGAPVMSSLATVYGLNGIHPALIQQIEVIRGPASTLYGTEAMGGVINIITKDPRFAPRLSINSFGTTHGEKSVDFAVAPQLGNLYTLFSGSVSHNSRFIDDNHDNFSDLPLNRRLALFNKWSVGPANNRTLDVSAKYYHEDRFGGTRQWTRSDRGSADVYGESIATSRWELVGNWRIPAAPLRLWFSANWHDQDSYYGSQAYQARQGIAFAQLLWDKRFADRHDVLIGGMLRHQIYDDNTPATPSFDRRTIPGVFAQDELAVSDRLTVLGGLRADFHSEHGVIPAPRLALKWQPRGDEETTVRLNAATGFRVVNLFTEDHAAYTGARQVVIAEALDPERSHTVTLGVNQHLHLDGSEEEAVVFDLDAFHTRFTNKIQPDYNSDPNLIVYKNLDGFAVTRGLSLSAQLSSTRAYSMTGGITIQEVFTEQSGERRALEFAPRVQGVLTTGYLFRQAGVGVDYTARVVGPMRLPEFPGRATRSPWFSEHHLQVTKSFAPGVDVYGAVKNLFDFRQRDPLVDPQNPFGESFDTSYIYGPIQGRRYLFGARYSLSR